LNVYRTLKASYFLVLKRNTGFHWSLWVENNSPVGIRLKILYISLLYCYYTCLFFTIKQLILYSSGKYLYIKVKSLKNYTQLAENSLDFTNWYEFKPVPDRARKFGGDPSSSV